jgi:hypothetical protein
MAPLISGLSCPSGLLPFINQDSYKEAYRHWSSRIDLSGEKYLMKRMVIELGLVVFVLFITASLVRADDRIVIADFSQGVDAKGVPNGWEIKEKSGHADFSVMTDNDLNAIQLRSANTSFSLQKKINVDVKQYPILSWKWKVTKLPDGGDFRESKTDDQAAQLFLAFSRTKAIVYVWETTAPEGLMADADAPPLMTIKVVVVRSGRNALGQWMTETRNVYEDYRKFFGDDEKSLKVSGLRIQINSQHTKSSAESYFADVAFQKQ